jgi:hypothetical protein
MPDDIAEVLARVGTVSRVADYYGVPGHTAKRWVRRIRRQG